ncbi:hypothetical protein [Streptomyces sp. NPDC055140]
MVRASPVGVFSAGAVFVEAHEVGLDLVVVAQDGVMEGGDGLIRPLPLLLRRGPGSPHPLCAGLVVRRDIPVHPRPHEGEGRHVLRQLQPRLVQLGLPARRPAPAPNSAPK